MKISKWQHQALYICAIGGALVITTPHSVKADVNVGTLIEHTNAVMESITHQTTRLVIAKSVNGQILQQEQTTVNWTKNSGSSLVPDARLIPPTIEGYTNTGGLLGSSMMENPAAKLNVFHLDYYPGEEQVNQYAACCRIDLEDESGKVYVSHIYCVPKGVQRQVNLELPAGMEFVNPNDQAYTITGKHRGQFSVMITPTTQTVEKDNNTEAESVEQSDKEKTNTAGETTPDTPDKKTPEVSESNEQVDTQGAGQQIDEGTNTEEPHPSVTDKGVQTDPTQLDTSSTVISEGVNTDPVKQVDESTNTDDQKPELVELGSQTELEPPIENPNDQSWQIIPPVHSGNEVIKQPESVDRDTQTTVEDTNVVTNVGETGNSTENINKETTNASEQTSALISQDQTSYPSVKPANGNELTEIMQTKRTNGATDEEVKQPSAANLMELAKYNRPFEDQDTTANQQLPQTGNHTGQLLVACGIALLALLGLFRNRSKH